MEFLDSESIIGEVGRRPCLYDATNPGHKLKDLRRDCWADVTRAVVGDQYDLVDDDTRTKYLLEVQRRWKSMKDTYIKSMKAQDVKGGDSAKRRKPYVYHRQMSFLQSHISEKEPISAPPPDIIVSPVQETVVEVDPLAVTPEVVDRVPPPAKRRRRDDPDTLERQLLTVLSAQTQGQDPVEMFLLSQAPLIRGLVPRDRLDFQIRFMQLLQSYTGK